MELKTLAQLAIEMAKMRADIEAGKTIELSWSAEKGKTPTQRNSLHRWLELLADELNAGGFDQTVWFKKYAKAGISSRWSKHSVKETFYKPVLESLTGKTSTEEMNTVEPSEVCQIVGQALSQRLGITPPAWPTRFECSSSD